MIANAGVELEQLIMKDNHKATKFFVEFYQLTSLIQYNVKALYQRAYLSLPKRIKDEWYTLINLTCSQTRDQSNKSNLNSDQCQNQDSPSNSSLYPNTNTSSNNNSKEKEKSKASTSQPKKTDYLDKLGKDSKLIPQEHQHHFDNKLSLVCRQSGHIMTACPKATKAFTAKVTSGKASKASAESPVKASEAKN